MSLADVKDEDRQIGHTYAFIKTGTGNRYLKYADAWGGFYIGFTGFPLDLVSVTYDAALSTHAQLAEFRKDFGVLREIYQMSLPESRSKVRLTLWNRVTSCLEIWQATDRLQPFPRDHLANLFNDCQSDQDLGRSKEWRKEVEQFARRTGAKDPPDNMQYLDHCAGASGYRFLPAKRLVSIQSERIYAPIDTLSVHRHLNSGTFRYMTKINPPQAEWPSTIFGGTTTYCVRPDGPVEETGYGRFVREYLDTVVDPNRKSYLQSLTYDQRIELVCATLNPLLVETAAMLFALDIGMVIDSGLGKGRPGIDVVAVCGKRTSAEHVIRTLQDLGLPLHPEAAHFLRLHGTVSFQCKSYGSEEQMHDKRLVRFGPMGVADSGQPEGISMQRALSLARKPEESAFHHLNDWLSHMCEIVVKPN